MCVAARGAALPCVGLGLVTLENAPACPSSHIRVVLRLLHLCSACTCASSYAALRGLKCRCCAKPVADVNQIVLAHLMFFVRVCVWPVCDGSAVCEAMNRLIH